MWNDIKITGYEFHENKMFGYETLNEDTLEIGNIRLWKFERDILKRMKKFDHENLKGDILNLFLKYFENITKHNIIVVIEI